MQIDQAIRRLLLGLRERIAAVFRGIRFRLPRIQMPKFAMPRASSFKWQGAGGIFGWLGGTLGELGLRGNLSVVAGVVALVVLYYVGGAWLSSKIDTDPKFQAPAEELQPGASHAVAITAALIDREAERWVPNDPFYKPSFILHNMPNFQRGMLQAFQRFTIELNDQLGRTRGSSPTDPDLEKAAGDIRYSADRWIWNMDRWWAINLTAEQSYRRASKELRAYNRRLAAGQATFDHRADNLKETLDGIANDLGSTSAAIEQFVQTSRGFPFNVDAARLFYRAKGQLYAFSMILKELRVDVADVLKEKNLEPTYAQMLDSFAQAVQLNPAFVLNGDPDSFFPNHLSSEGFYLLRARTQLSEITAILQA